MNDALKAVVETAVWGCIRTGISPNFDYDLFHLCTPIKNKKETLFTDSAVVKIFDEKECERLILRFAPFFGCWKLRDALVRREHTTLGCIEYEFFDAKTYIDDRISLRADGTRFHYSPLVNEFPTRSFVPSVEVPDFEHGTFRWVIVPDLVGRICARKFISWQDLNDRYEIWISPKSKVWLKKKEYAS